MDPIRVPRPPRKAFNKNRPISDLIKAQVKHFQHLESKLHSDLQSPMEPHELTTESAAANYIAYMTNVLCGSETEKSSSKSSRSRSVSRPARKASSGIAIAAVKDKERSARPARAKKSSAANKSPAAKKSSKAKSRGKKS